MLVVLYSLGGSQVWLQEDTEERLRQKQKFTRDTHLETRGCNVGPHGKHRSGQEAEDRGRKEHSGHGLYWALCGKGKEGQCNEFRIN